MHMIENDQLKTLRPLQPLVNTVEQQGLVVLNYVTSLPIIGEQYISPYYVISLCERGTVEVEYDMKQFDFAIRETQTKTVDDISALDHAYDAVVTEPTCTEHRKVQDAQCRTFQCSQQVLYDASCLPPERRAVPADEPGIRPVGVGKFHRSDMSRGDDAQRIPHHHHDAF